VDNQDKTFKPFDWSKVPNMTEDGKLIIDHAEIFEKVIKRLRKETGHSAAEIMDLINNDPDYIVIPEVFDEVYKRLHL